MYPTSINYCRVKKEIIDLIRKPMQSPEHIIFYKYLLRLLEKHRSKIAILGIGLGCYQDGNPRIFNSLKILIISNKADKFINRINLRGRSCVLLSVIGFLLQ